MTREPPLPVVVEELLEDVHRGLIASVQRRVRAAGFEGVRAAHDCVFRFLEPGGVRLRELADRAGKTPQSVGEHVDELERLGYLERVADPGDRRAKLIRPTARGAAAMRAALDALREMERDWNEAVGPRRLGQMRTALEAIRKLQADGGEDDAGSSRARKGPLTYDEEAAKLRLIVDTPHEGWE